MKKSKAADTLWAGAILVSLVLVLFSLVFVSCTKAPETAETPSPEAELSERPDVKEPDAELPETKEPDAELPETSGEPVENTEMPEGNSPVPEHNDDSGIVTPESPAPVQTPETNVSRPETPKTGLTETADQGREYLDQFIFLGDSTTYGLGYYYDHGYKDLVPPTQVWTPTSGTLTLDQWSYVAMKNPETDEEQMLTDLLSLKQPKYLCITLGVNGVSFMKEDYFKQSYTSLVQKVQELSPDTTIILNSIYPVTSGYEAKNNGINNLKIEAANLWIASIAQSCGVHYLDSASVLRDDNGRLPDSYTNGDGLHLNGEAFGLVVEYIRTHAC